MYLSKENVTCPKEQVSLYLSVPFKNSIKPDINSLVNSVDPDQLASSGDS